MLGAVGVVYGDIGTSPLYTIKEIFSPVTGIAPTPDHIVGAASTVFWALMLVVTLKYVTLIMRADNGGEGGSMALLTLVRSAPGMTPRLRSLLLLIGMCGAALFFGECVLTPSISVLSAVEGLELLAPGLEQWVLPVAVAILVSLFAVQRYGTARVAAWFGPLISLWFLMLAATGIWYIVQVPHILAALDPRHAVHFLAEQGWGLFLVVGAVVLAVTGVEALYADMGHFGRRPIRIAWTAFVLPSLTLNYFGQSALLLSDPTAVENPFYRLFPASFLLPAIVLASLATVIASQAVISGAYSMTRQAIQLGLLPRLQVVHTSAHEAGQIYLPTVNWILLAAVIAATVGFGSSSALAAAYGLAVTLTMLLTTVLTCVVVRYVWGYPLWVALTALGFFLLLDALLVISCGIKFLHGGWFPILIAVGLLVLMTTWRRGRELVLEKMRAEDTPLPEFLGSLARDELPLVARTAVFLVSHPDTVPPALLHNLKHNNVLHERNILLTVVFSNKPWIPFGQRVRIKMLNHHFWSVEIHFGFMNHPDVPKALELCAEQGLDFDVFSASFFLSRETVVPSPGEGMTYWREALFAAMSRNAGSTVDYFRIPSNNVIELGTRVHI